MVMDEWKIVYPQSFINAFVQEFPLQKNLVEEGNFFQVGKFLVEKRSQLFKIWHSLSVVKDITARSMVCGWESLR
jgi:hypothetical protein